MANVATSGNYNDLSNKPTIPAAQIQSDWTQTDSTKKDFIKNKIPIWITTGSADDNMSPIDSVTDGNMRPVTSNAVADIMSSLPTDAILHYSFDNVPDFPDGAKNNIDNYLWDSYNTTKTDNPDGTKTYQASNPSLTAYYFGFHSDTNIAGKIFLLKYKIISGTFNNFNFFYCNATTGTFLLGFEKKGDIVTIRGIIPSGATNGIRFAGIDHPNTVVIQVLAIYIGDGSYNTPVIDNADGQWDSISQNGVTVQGVSGKGIKQWDSRIEIGNFNLNDNFTISIWVNPENNTTGKLAHILRKDGQFILRNGTVTNAELQAIVIQNNQATVIGGSLLSANTWQNLVVMKDNLRFCVYINGTRISQTTLSQSAIDKNNNVFYIGRYDNNNPNTRPQSYDDLLIFDRALSETEVQALYLNKANTPKYYSWADWKLSQIS